MAYIIADRVRDTTTTTGTGDLTISGTAPTGFRTFASVAASGDSFFYCVSSSGGSEWEVGVGTIAGTTTIKRSRVLASSNSNALVTLSAGTKDVFIDIPAEAVQSLGQNYITSAGLPTL